VYFFIHVSFLFILPVLYALAQMFDFNPNMLEKKKSSFYKKKTLWERYKVFFLYNL